MNYYNTKLIGTIICVCFLMVWYSPSYAKKPHVDLTGIPLFWEIADLLESGELPTEDEWSKLFNHPAYAQIQKSGNRCTQLKKLMPLVFMPTGGEELKKTLESGSELSRRICNHLLQVKSNRITLENFAQTSVFEEWLVAAQQLLSPYVPKGSLTFDQFPQIYVILFEDNGFGYPNIVLDLQRLYSSPESCNISLIGHEAHHVFLHQLSKFKFPERNNPYYPIVNALSGLHSEGIACMIDKQDWLEEENAGCDLEYQIEFREAFMKSKEIFQEFDSLFTAVQRGDMGLSDLKDIKSKLLWGGHANGMYMAKAIQENKGTEFLASLIYHPFDFIEGYNQSAKMSGRHYVFSDTAMKFLATVKIELNSK